MRRWLFPIGVLIWSIFMVVPPVGAHANLLRAFPVANSSVQEPPQEIRLWFTEPLEPNFSHITLRDQTGTEVQTLPSQVDENDSTQLFIYPGDLPDGVYTVSWRVLSATDGHTTQGSFSITIGAVAGASGGAALANENIPADSSIIRWLNLISMSLAVGSIGFWLFVWAPISPQGDDIIETRMNALLWMGWMLLGFTGVLALMLQVSIAVDVSLTRALTHPALMQMIMDTRYGWLWLARMSMWIGMGAALYYSSGDRWFLWPALCLGIGILLTNSLYSHATAAADSMAATAADWLHFSATALWIGGLAQFFNVLGPVRASDDHTAAASALVAHFSNYARVAVAALTITGLYAAWLQVGSISALLTTLYGQTLFFKLCLFVPLLVIAAVNLLITHRRLSEGAAVWVGRLRGLVAAEIALTITVLAAVGIMTAVAPARGIADSRASVPQMPLPQPITLSDTAEGVNVALEVTPGWVGENNFNITLTDASGALIEDASLIRLRLLTEDPTVGENEIRPEAQGSGLYSIASSALSLPGEWRLRATIQRPGQYDAVVDFNFNASAMPDPIIPPPPPTPENLPNRVTMLLFTGMLAVAVGAFFLGENRMSQFGASKLLAVALSLAGMVFLASAALSVGGGAVSAADDPAPIFAPEPDVPVEMAFATGLDMPYLLTAEGGLLRPDDTGSWDKLALNAAVRDLFVDARGTLYAATDTGLIMDGGRGWEVLDDVPSTQLVSTHGYLFSLGSGAIMRGPDHWRSLEMPAPELKANEFVMLGNHSHVLHYGEGIYLTSDLGLTWGEVTAPGPISLITTDLAGSLMIVTADGLFTYNGGWQLTMPLPDGAIITAIRFFQNEMFVTAGGRLYQRAGAEWQAISLPESEDSSYLIDLGIKYPRALWALDSGSRRLYWTSDASTWNLQTIGE